jgi:histone-lysine N-methyltransferase SETMAR
LKSINAWKTSLERGSFSIFPKKKTGRKKKDFLLTPLKKAIEKFPSASGRSLGKIVKCDAKTAIRKLECELDIHRTSMRYVPHRLLPSHIGKRMEIASELREFLEQQEKESFRRIFTGDESWVLYDNSAKFVWLEKGQLPPEVEEKSISSKKILLTVFFSGERVWHISFLRKGDSMNSDKIISTVLQPLHNTLSSLKPPLIRPWFIHYDNARPHVSVKTETYLKETSFIRLEAPPYSPDLSPCDFYLFGTLKSHILGNLYA